MTPPAEGLPGEGLGARSAPILTLLKVLTAGLVGALPQRGRGAIGRTGRAQLSGGGTTGAAEALAGSQRLTARRAAPHRRAAITAESIAVLYNRTALPGRHAHAPTLSTPALHVGT
jgi:hypothetical protein